MGELLTIEEIYAKYPNEWVLIDKPEKDKHRGTVRGIVVFHSPDRDEVDAKTLELPIPRNIAVRFTGRPSTATSMSYEPIVRPIRRGHLIIADLAGPGGSAELVLALDTGSSCSTISEAKLRAIGIDPAQPTGIAHITFGGGTLTRPMVTALQLTALGVAVLDYKVVCHTLPPSAGVEGVLGLDFFAGHVLTIDFINNTLDLT